MVKKRTRGNPVPLIVEEHPADYDGYPFITLIQYRKEHILAIVDNADDKTIRSFVLDLCGPCQVDEEQVIGVASSWYENRRDRYPVSFEFSRMGMAMETGKILRSFNAEFVTRVIGPLPRFDLNEVQSVKRRRRKAVPVGMEVHRKVVQLR